MLPASWNWVSWKLILAGLIGFLNRPFVPSAQIGKSRVTRRKPLSWIQYSWATWSCIPFWLLSYSFPEYLQPGRLKSLTSLLSAHEVTFPSRVTVGIVGKREARRLIKSSIIRYLLNIPPINWIWTPWRLLRTISLPSRPQSHEYHGIVGPFSIMSALDIEWMFELLKPLSNYTNRHLNFIYSSSANIFFFKIGNGASRYVSGLSHSACSRLGAVRLIR